MYWLCLLEGDGEVTWRCEEEAGNRESHYKVVRLGGNSKECEPLSYEVKKGGSKRDQEKDIWGYLKREEVYMRP